MVSAYVYKEAEVSNEASRGPESRNSYKYSAVFTDRLDHFENSSGNGEVFCSFQ